MTYAYQVTLTAPDGTTWQLHFTAPDHAEGKSMVDEIVSLAANDPEMAEACLHLDILPLQ